MWSNLYFYHFSYIFINLHTEICMMIYSAQFKTFLAGLFALGTIPKLSDGYYSPSGIALSIALSVVYIFSRKYIPALSKFPVQYIYEPWTAPKAVQEKCGCIIGKDYPKPIVDHDEARKANISRMAAAYARRGGGGKTGNLVKKKKKTC